MQLPAIGALFTAGVLLHNLEEAIWLPGWSEPRIRLHRSVSPSQFRLAAALFSAALIGLTAAATYCSPWLTYAMAGYALGMVLNALAPHLLATIVTRRYMPGTATALLLNVPLGLLYLMTAFAEHRIAGRTFAWACPLVALALALSLPLWFTLARTLRRLLL